MRDTRARLRNVLDAIEKIEARRPEDMAAFMGDELLQVWMVHHLMIIGEAVRSIDPAFKQRHLAIPWREIAGMRNILVHDYFRINGEIVWQTIERDIPALKEQASSLFSTFPNTPEGAP